MAPKKPPVQAHQLLCGLTACWITKLRVRDAERGVDGGARWFWHAIWAALAALLVGLERSREAIPVSNADPRGRAWVGQRPLRVIRPEQHPDRFRDGGLLGYAGGYEVGADGRLRDRGKTMETGGRVRAERRLAAILAAMWRATCG